MGRDGVVGIATYYGLEGPGIKFLWGRYFSLEPTYPPVQLVAGTGGKTAEVCP
jgi:hypothetical protein